ncbi:MAG: hypothetical protein ACN4GT_09265 [Gammaproteobacteria bacterium]
MRSVDEFQRRFGAPGHRCRLQDLLTQFFENGGTNAIVVRVSASGRRHRIAIPGPAGSLVLSALNPGPHECLRVSVDYDGIPAGDSERFNLVVHRLVSRDRPIVEDQEIYRAVSIDPGDPDFVAQAVIESELIRVEEPVPLARPDVTRCPGVAVGAAYEYVDDDWRERAVLTDYDMIGCDTEATGIFALDRIPILDVVCLVPDEGEVGPVALFAAEAYCRARHAMLFVDPTAAWKCVADVVKDRLSTVFSSPNVVTYFPRPRAASGTGLSGQPSALGALIGRLVADDFKRGIWGARDESSLTFRYRTRLECALDEHDVAALKRLGVNALRECVGGHLQIGGLVTMSRSRGIDAQWSDLRMRRLGMFIVGSIARGTRWVAFDDGDERGAEDIHEQVSAFLTDLRNAGALSESVRGESWYVTKEQSPCGPSGATQFIVGFSLSGEDFVAFRFVHDRLDCRVQPVAWQPGVALAS